MSEEAKKEEEAKSTADHNGITQAMYDEAKRKERIYYGQATDYEKKLQKYGGEEAIEAMKAELDSLKTKEAKTPKEVEALIAERTEAATKSIIEQTKELEEKLTTTAARLHKIEVIDAATNEIAGVFSPDIQNVVKEMYINKYVKKDDDGALIVTDENEQPRYVGSQKMTVKDFAEEILEKHPSFGASQSSNNSRPSGSASSSVKDGDTFNEKTYQALTDKQARIDYFRKTVVNAEK